MYLLCSSSLCIFLLWLHVDELSVGIHGETKGEALQNYTMTLDQDPFESSCRRRKRLIQ